MLAQVICTVMYPPLGFSCLLHSTETTTNAMNAFPRVSTSSVFEDKLGNLVFVCDSPPCASLVAPVSRAHMEFGPLSLSPVSKIKKKTRSIKRSCLGILETLVNWTLHAPRPKKITKPKRVERTRNDDLFPASGPLLSEKLRCCSATPTTVFIPRDAGHA